MLIIYSTCGNLINQQIKIHFVLLSCTFSLSLSIQKSYFHRFFVHCQDRIFRRWNNSPQWLEFGCFESVESIETMRHRRRHQSQTIVHVHVRPTEKKSTISYKGDLVANQSAPNGKLGISQSQRPLSQVSFTFDYQRRRKRTFILF